MAPHTHALVPLEAWSFNSPDVRANGRHVDVGLMAEALIYYETIAVNVGNAEQFAELVDWFASRGQYANFLSLVREGTISVYDYAFHTNPFLKDGVYTVYNIQDQVQAEPNTFERRVLYNKAIETVLPKSRDRRTLYETMRGHVVEVKSDQFGATIENARADFRDVRRQELIVQALVDSLYDLKRLGRPPEVRAVIASSTESEKHTIKWNIDFDQLTKIAGKEVGLHLSNTIAAGAISNRYVWSAALTGADLYLGNPMSALVGDKLYESARTPTTVVETINKLTANVEFPDVRRLVNSDDLTLNDVLAFRSRAKRFRLWLQEGAERDRDAIVAYHQEVARESGFSKGTRKAFSLFGVLGSGAVGSALGSALEGTAGAAIGGAAGSSLGFLIDVASKLGSNWKPVVFGNWMKDRIEKLMNDKLASW